MDANYTEALALACERLPQEVYAHSRRVASRFPEGSVERTVALLHDLVEDSDTEPGELACLFPYRIVEAVQSLTRLETETYFDYIRRLSHDPLAVDVKRADLQDHLEQAATLRPSLRGRYEKAMGMLDALVDMNAPICSKCGIRTHPDSTFWTNKAGIMQTKGPNNFPRCERCY